MSARFGSSFVAALLLVFGLHDPMRGQDDPPADPPAAESEGDLTEEITVTAQKREQRLSDVPLAVTALDAETIEAARIEKVEEVEASTPNLHFQTIGVARPQVYLRGVGTGAFDAGSDPSVSVFVDEVYVSRFGAMQFDLFDLERIEILKGPQGALFGRNTAGGAINVVTRRASDDFAARFEAGGGNLSAGSLRGLVNGSFSDTVFGRLSAAAKKRDGYSDNLTTGDDENDEDSIGARGQLELQPSDRTSVNLNLDWGRDRLSMWANESITPAIFLIFPPIAPLFAPTPDRFSETYTRSGYQDRDQLGGHVRLDHQTGAGTLTSITSYRDYELDELQDLDSTLADTTDRRAVEDARTFTQELRLTSSTAGRFDWLVGVYYLEERVDRLDDTRLGVDSVLARVFNGGRAFAPVWNDEFETESWAGFGEVNVALTDRLNLNFGGRYGEDDKSLERSASNVGVASPILPVSYESDPSDSWSSFDPQASVDYHFTDRAMAYVSYREGFKSGGFQYLSATAANSDITFDPENVTLVEAGLKARTRSGRAIFDVSLFDTDYEDLQVLAATGTTGGGGFIVAITNAAQAEASGGEIGLTLRPATGLDLGLGYGYLDATFDEYVDGNGRDQSGNTLARSPESTGHVSAQYSFALGDWALSMRAMWSYKDKIYFDPDNTEGLAQPSNELIDASIAWETLDSRWRVTAWGKNLTDEAYYKNVIPLSSSLVGIATMGVPRTYGLTLGLGF